MYQPFRFEHIPIALLSGLTLYMGVVATFGVQFFKRLELMFMAPSQHPYIEYLDNVSILMGMTAVSGNVNCNSDNLCQYSNFEFNSKAPRLYLN